MKKFIIYAGLLLLTSCSHSVTLEDGSHYKILDKKPAGDGYCFIYWFDEYKLRRNKVKCSSCYIGQEIGKDGLRI